MSRYRENRGAADRYERELRAAPDLLPNVDVWIASYDEGWDILEKTVIASLHLDYPRHKLRVYVLDDSRRAWLGERCAEVGAVHVTRSNNIGKKAGNHTNALGQTTAPFIVSLDADFVPFANFIYRVLGFFEDPRVAIVQTPQTFHNRDVVRSNLGLSTRTAPDDLAIFYREQQPARDAWDAAFYCGSCAMVRRSAIQAIGGFVQETDIEDQATSVKLLANGYICRYLNETLSVGLSAESAAVLHDQRNRWCRGSVQIEFMPFGPFGRGLSLVHRLMFNMTFWVSNSVGPLLWAITPSIFWGLGWHIYPVPAQDAMMILPISLFLAVITSLTWLTRGHWSPIFTPATELFYAFELAPTAIASFLKPFGKPLVQMMAVTLKGDAAVGNKIDWRTLIFLVTLMTVTSLSLVWALLSGSAIVREPIQVTVSLFWTLHALALMAVAALMCFEPAYREEAQFEVAQPAVISGVGEHSLAVLIHRISVGGAWMRWDAPLPQAGGNTEVEIDMPIIGIVRGLVERIDAEAKELEVRFVDLTGETKNRLMQAIFCNPALQCQPESFPLGGVLGGIAQRFFG